MTVNWAGMDIVPGAIVWRGARAGNTSDFKIGRVQAVTGDKARVEWLFCPANYRHWTVRRYILPDEWEHLPGIQRMKSSGSPTVDSLALVEVDLDALNRVCDEWDELYKRAKWHQDNGSPRVDKP